MTGWLLIAFVIGGVWSLWHFLNLISDMFEQWYAAHKREAMSTNKEKRSSSL